MSEVTLSVRSLADQTLDEIAATVNENHRQVEHHLALGLEKALVVGEALIEARRRVPFGTWLDWLEGNCPDLSRFQARIYMRVFFYRNALPDTISGLSAARVYLRGLPPSDDVDAAGTRRGIYPQAVVDEVKKLRGQKLTHREISERLDIPEGSVAYLLDSKAAAKKVRRRRANAEKALKFYERNFHQDKAARKVKGPGSNAYILIRQAAQFLEEFRTSADPESREHVDRAFMSLYAAEDALVEALRTPESEQPPG